MLELFVSSFVTFFVVIDPPGCAPIFAGLTAGATTAHRRAMAVRAVIVSAIILLVFALVGEPLLHGLGIELASFRIDSHQQEFRPRKKCRMSKSCTHHPLRF